MSGRQPKSFSHCPGISSVIFDVCAVPVPVAVVANIPPLLSFAWMLFQFLILILFRFLFLLLLLLLLSIKAAWLSFCCACGALCQTRGRLVIYVASFNLTQVSKKRQCKKSPECCSGNMQFMCLYSFCTF